MDRALTPEPMTAKLHNLLYFIKLITGNVVSVTYINQSQHLCPAHTIFCRFFVVRSSEKKSE